MLQHISNYQLEKVLRLVHHTQTAFQSGGNRTLIIFSYNSTSTFHSLAGDMIPFFICNLRSTYIILISFTVLRITVNLSSRSRARTYDLEVNSFLLYQLSYTGLVTWPLASHQPVLSMLLVQPIYYLPSYISNHLPKPCPSGFFIYLT